MLAGLVRHQIGNTDYMFWINSSSSDDEEQLADVVVAGSMGSRAYYQESNHADASGLTTLGKYFDLIHFSAIICKLEATTTPAP